MQLPSLPLALETIAEHPDYLVLQRVPEIFVDKSSSEDQCFVASIIDLETMGLNPSKDEIIEIGLLSFLFDKERIISVTEQFNGLQEPSTPIPEEITRITGITDDDVRGKAIDWGAIEQLIQKSHLIICHNAGFDRNFLELQTPVFIQDVIKKRAFGCSQKDVNWHLLGYESAKLEYLNFKLGYFYDGHRALTDCWATLNILIEQEGAFEELKESVRKKQLLICAENADFDKKDLLKSRGYRWSDGKGALPKCWYAILEQERLAEEKAWLDDIIYDKAGTASRLKSQTITAYNRNSLRAQGIE